MGLSNSGFVLGVLIGAVVGFGAGALAMLVGLAARASKELDPPSEIPRGRYSRLFNIACAAMALFIVSWLAFELKLDKTGAVLLLMLVVLIIARLLGRTYGIAATVVASELLNYFFLPPIWSLGITGSDNWLAFTLFLVGATLGSHLAGRSNEFFG
jgi:K+-sensing histidine kinase KdpD